MDNEPFDGSVLLVLVFVLFDNKNKGSYPQTYVRHIILNLIQKFLAQTSSSEVCGFFFFLLSLHLRFYRFIFRRNNIQKFLNGKALAKIKTIRSCGLSESSSKEAKSKTRAPHARPETPVR